MTNAEIMAVTCPNCQAKPGEQCTRPTERGREPVRWLHYSRADAAGTFDSVK